MPDYTDDPTTCDCRHWALGPQHRDGCPTRRRDEVAHANLVTGVRIYDVRLQTDAGRIRVSVAFSPVTSLDRYVTVMDHPNIDGLDTITSAAGIRAAAEGT